MHLCNLHHAQPQCALRTCKSPQPQHLHTKNSFKFKDRLHTVVKRSASMGRLGSFRPVPLFGAAILWTTLLSLLSILTEVQVVCAQEEGLPPPCPLCLQKPPRIPRIPREKQHKHEKKQPRKAHETPQALTDLRQYLQQFGYLETPPWGKTPVLKDMGEAIGLFQRCFGLPETKSLDAITYEKISQPRCGRPDYVGARPDSSIARKFAPFLRANVVGRQEEFSSWTDNSGVGPPGVDKDDSHCLLDSSAIAAASFNDQDGRDGTPVVASQQRCITSRTSVRRDTSGRMEKAKNFAYFFGKPRWPTTRYKLTWSLSPTNITRRLSRDTVRAAFTQAFDVWEKMVPVFAFDEAEDYECADVKISFVSGDHGDSQKFDGVLGVIAHAFSPEDGRVHFDDAEVWSVDVTRERHMPHALDLVSVAIHEVGHVIGLAHSPVKKSVMFPSLPPHREKRKLSADDVQGARELYGLLQVQAPGPQAAFSPKPAIGLGNSNAADAHLNNLVLSFLVIFVRLVMN